MLIWLSCTENDVPNAYDAVNVASNAKDIAALKMIALPPFRYKDELIVKMVIQKNKQPRKKRIEIIIEPIRYR